MTRALGLLSLLLLGGLAAGAVPKQPKGVVESLNLDNGLNRGEWGPIALCPDGSTAFAFEIKYSGTGYADDTCVNAIRLYCQDSAGSLTASVTSSEGSYGQWKGMRTCPGGENFNAMRANVVPDMGTFGDDLGMDNLQLQCSGGNVLDGLYGTPAKGQGPMVVREMKNLGDREVEAVHMKLRKSAHARDLGEWGAWANCSVGNKICGLQVRLEDDHLVEDDAGVSDVIMFCCN
ncbi:vitelline membrane outer layer protein 1 homolog [Eriocheir sinensis]|uniref:vitelline membrane outer layer protein 1 homolog n=1 Tax=Eriocheir sinensis TaxID=95602 RepID=UPI0021C8085E|nr:vitelline membrane outer layer protein 1 homolog [Eriocheir sinensis]